MMTGLITVLTDFGTQDGYVGAMKGVLLSELPSARIVDLTHQIAPQDVMAGAFALAQAVPYFPSGTVHLAVVDPGVGSKRRALIIEAAGSLFVGPDNGLFSLAAAGRAWSIDQIPVEWGIHPTFHGRDLFARVAARIAGGAAVAQFATEQVLPHRIVLPEVAEVDSHLVGEVIQIDRFGNLITNLSGERVADAPVEIGSLRIPFVRTFADVPSGQLLAFIGSAGYLEIAVREGSAAARLELQRGAKVSARSV